MRSVMDPDGATLKRRKSIFPIRNLQRPYKGISWTLGLSAPLPDKKLSLFILDRIQKKGTYSVCSEPVDPNEVNSRMLPDYHEVIEQPMDFGTVRKKLVSGAYGNLGQFEARSIQELAKKNFENLRKILMVMDQNAK